MSNIIYVELTDAQAQVLEPLMYEVRLSNLEGDGGAILAQVHRRRDGALVLRARFVDSVIAEGVHQVVKGRACEGFDNETEFQKVLGYDRP
jgi:hypothetical protein